MTRIAVVGAGIVGAAIAHHAARRGAEVTLIDPHPPGTGATGASFGWIGESVIPGGRVLAEWRHLELSVPDVNVHWIGSLTWPGTADEHGTQVDAARLAELEPGLRNPPHHAIHRPSDGAVDPAATTRALAAGLPHIQAYATSLPTAGSRTTGVEISAVASAGNDPAAPATSPAATSPAAPAAATSPTPALGGPQATGRVRQNSEAETAIVTADTVVVAAGADSRRLCADSALRIETSPAVLIRYDAPPGLVNTVINGPVEVRQTPDGQLLAPAACSPNPTPSELDDITRRTTAAIKANLIGADSISIRSVEVGNRPMPTDGKPVIGPLHDGLYLAVMHSGVTLAPLVARLVTHEILDHEEQPALATFRPTRFTRTAP